MKRFYLAGPMRGIPEFNFPAFHEAAWKLRNAGYEVFSPAERDESVHGVALSKDNPTGDEALATAKHGFNLREALLADMTYICQTATGIAMLPGWEKSKGATAEKATAEALALEVIYL